MRIELVRSHWYSHIYDEQENGSADVELLLELLDGGCCKIFEACCGSGRILTPLAAAGHKVYGMDLDGAMLSRVPSKAGDASNVCCRKGNVLTEDWGNGYDVAVLGGNILLNIETTGDYQEAQRALLRRAAACLSPGGHVFLDFNLTAFPERIFGNKEPRVIFEGTDDQGVWGRMTLLDGRYDSSSQICISHRSTELRLPGGEIRCMEEESRKYIPRLAEVRSWLADCGFAVEREYGTYGKAPVSNETDRAILWAAKRR